jgi:hypothetical protein
MRNNLLFVIQRDHLLFCHSERPKGAKNLSPNLFLGILCQILQSFYETKFHQLLQNDNGQVAVGRWKSCRGLVWGECRYGF